jgi:hypothetical protein
MYEIFYNKKLYTDLLVTNFAKYNMVWVRRIISLFIFKKNRNRKCITKRIL